MVQTVVIGGGLAGLSAAYELIRAGWDVQVFEAQKRIGGRVYTAQLNGGQYGELGAEFVDHNHTAVLNYADEFNLKLDPACRFPDDLYLFMDGMLNNRKYLTAQNQAALENWDTDLKTLTKNQEDPQATLDQWLDERLLPSLIRQYIRLQASSLFATDPELIGIGFFAYSSGVNGWNMRIHGGSSRLVEALATNLGERLHTDTPVRRIRQTEENITVSIETKNGLVEVVADRVIVAIPWSVMHNISMEISLMDAQREAIASLSYGGGVKTLLQYPYGFWSQPNLGIVLLQGEYQVIWEPTFAQRGKQKIISCSSGGKESLKLSERAIDSAVATVRAVFPDAPEIITSASYDWSADQWARGAYCYFSPGELNHFHPYLKMHLDRVFFAGEHTAPVEYRGYMEGAIRSGQNAAQQIITGCNSL